MTTPGFWYAVEAVHAPVYFADEQAVERFGALGLKGFWMGYFASRSAALGTPGPEVVTALFHGFAPTKVAKALPDAWSFADRDAVLETRLDLARDLLTPVVDDPAPLVAHLGEVLARADFAGKALAAAHAALPVPDDPVGALWHHATALRELHGDAHVAVLTAAGIDGATANALAVAAGLVPPGQQLSRGWDDAAWDHAYEQLHMRGWVDEWRSITDAGRGARARIEETTHRVANAALGDREAVARTIAVTDTVTALATRIGEAGLVPYPNPTGVPGA